MKVFKIKELHLSMIFLGMLIGLVLADSFTFYHASLFRNQYINPLQGFGFFCVLFISVLLFLQIHKQRNKQNLFAIINNTEGLIWSIDKNYRYLAFNEAFEKKIRQLFKRPIRVGEAVWNDKQGKDQLLIWKRLFDRGLNGEKFSVDMDYSEKACEPFFVNVSFNPVYDGDGKVKGVGCFLQNITQRLLHEQEINRQNRKFKEIAFIISHDVRAPLSNILGLVEFLDKTDSAKDDNKQLVEYIKVSARQLDEVVRNVVDRTVKLNTEDAQTKKVHLIS
ncbi:MAG TPA: histidine kinase dimerization/phospho-acceptor domain-containing protein [Segetibacter sp.]|jgi:PAS domain S-box-containing protein